MMHTHYRHIYFLLILACLFFASSASAQRFVLKTDLQGWAAVSLNIEPEVKISPRSTLAMAVSYNPFTMNSVTNMKWRHIYVQPEYRYWTCAAFNGSFIAAHAGYMYYNIGGIPTTLNIGFAQQLAQYRFQGHAVTLGVGYGYHWMITSHFSMEAEIGLGVGWTKADKWEAEKCGELVETPVNCWFFTPTKLAINFVWLIL